MGRKEKRLKRRRKAERKKQRRIWYKGDTCQLKKYMEKNWYFIPHVFEKGIDYLPNPKPKSEEARKYIEKLVEGVEAVKNTINDMAKNLAEQGDAVRILEILKPFLKETVEIKKDSHLLSMRFKGAEFVTWDMVTNEDAKNIKIIERWLEK